MTNEDGEGLSASEIQHRATRGAVWTALHVALAVPMGFVVTAVTARMLQPAGYGSLAFYTVVFAVAVQATDFGYTSAVTQWGSAARAAGRVQEVQKFLSQVTGFHLMVQCPLLLVTSVVVLRAEGPGVAFLYASFSAFGLYLSGASLALVLDQRNDQLARAAIAANVISQVLVLVAVVMTQDPVAVLLARSAAFGIPGGIAMVFLRGGLRSAVVRPGWPGGVPAGFRSFATYSWLSSLLALLIFSRSEVVLLEGLSTTEAVGLFALAFGIAQQLTGPVDAVVAPLIPATASLVAEHSERVREAVCKAMRISALFTGFLNAIAVPVIFGVFSTVFGKDYATSAWLFVVLAVVSTLQTACHPLALLMEALRLGRRMFLSHATALAVNLAVAFSLIPLLGVWGALFANVTGQAAALAFTYVVVTSAGSGLTGNDVLSGLRPWLCSLVAMTSGLAAAAAFGHLLPVVAAFAFALLALLAYLALLRITGSRLPLRDIEAVLEALPSPLARWGRRLTPLVATQ